MIESDEVALGDGLSARARRRRSRDAPAGLPEDPHATVAVLALETSTATAARSRPPAAACAGCRPRCGCGTTPSPRSGRPPGRAPTAAPGSTVPLATGLRRPQDDCLLAAEEEDPLRAFCGLVARRTPRAGELAWALRRFELGCERGSAVEALTDWLLAARALFADTDRPGYERRRRAARGDLRRGARPRPRCEQRVREAISLERAAMAGSSRPRTRSRRSSPSSARACARCCATCSAATSTRRCAARRRATRTGVSARGRGPRRRARPRRARGRRSSAGRRARRAGASRSRRRGRRAR